MTRTDIIVQLWEDADIRQAIGKMQPVELHDDLRQEMFLVICELDEDRLVKMHAEGWIKFFLVRTMLNMVKSDRSTFFRKFRTTFTEFIDQYGGHVEISSNFAEEREAANVVNCVEALPWYDRELLKLYAEDKNIAKLSKETRIPYRSLFKTITKAKIKVRKAMQKNKQGRLMGHDAICSMEISIDIQNDKKPEEIAEVLEEISAVIRERIAGRMYGDVSIVWVNDLKIVKLI